MIILGIRNAPQAIRYIILKYEDRTSYFVNKSGENILRIPKTTQTIQDKVFWLHHEYSRVIDQNPETEMIALKVNEFSRRGETLQSRETSYYDSIVHLIASERGLRIETMLYSQIGTKRSDVKVFAEEHVGISKHYWNEQMADSIAAAYALAAM